MFPNGKSAQPLVILAVAALVGLGLHLLEPASSQAQAADTAQPAKPLWAASATGRVEPKSGQILIGTQMPGRVADVAVHVNDKVRAGDLLVRLDEDDLITRLSAAMAEVQVREREREEEPAKGLQLDHRQADDAVSAAERALFRARLTFDDISFRMRTGTGRAVDVEAARAQIAKAKDQLVSSRAVLGSILAREGLPLATRLESSLASARAELSLAEAAVERARIRAPIDGTVLSVLAKFGELVTPSAEAPVVVIGDMTGLRVKAEVEEREVTKVKLGQRVVIKGDAFPDRTFEGTVTEISPSMSVPRILTRGVRKPNDLDVIEVTVSVDGEPVLIPGMRVDVFFKADKAEPATHVRATAAAEPTPEHPN